MGLLYLWVEERDQTLDQFFGQLLALSFGQAERLIEDLPGIRCHAPQVIR